MFDWPGSHCTIENMPWAAAQKSHIHSHLYFLMASGYLLYSISFYISCWKQFFFYLKWTFYKMNMSIDLLFPFSLPEKKECVQPKIFPSPPLLKQKITVKRSQKDNINIFPQCGVNFWHWQCSHQRRCCGIRNTSGYTSKNCSESGAVPNEDISVLFGSSVTF